MRTLIRIVFVIFIVNEIDCLGGVCDYCCDCCRKKGYQKVNYLAPDEKEISFKDYSSPNDAPLSEVESSNN